MILGQILDLILPLYRIVGQRPRIYGDLRPTYRDNLGQNRAGRRGLAPLRAQFARIGLAGA